ncbi:lipid-A-disaccharide synthase [Fretibacter rubidus]|uniref:lipid-A-disaccharide synthase n=1 Tax=Fretibacter rubidus TaxID=570162 RepID=UPI003529FD0F
MSPASKPRPTSKSVFIIAVENSGDQLGAGLIRAIRAQNADVMLSGIGGAAMAGEGVSSDIDISALSILGFVEAVKVYPTVLKRVKEVVAVVKAQGPDAVILIDSWGFMIRVAQRLKEAGYTGQIIKYVAPQVWAMREGRAKILAKAVDHLLTIHSFDAPYFTRHGLPVTYVGNPVFDTDYRSGDGAAFRKAHNIAKQSSVIGVMFGSRQGEIARLAPTLAAAAGDLQNKHTDAVLIAPVATSIKDHLLRLAKTDPNVARIKFVDQGELVGAMAAMDVGLACSGTVTTQLASAGVPTVVAYKLAPMTFFVAKRLFKPDYISIVNIAAGKALMPEFIQDNATAVNMAAAADNYLSSPETAQRTRDALRAQTQTMQAKGGTASEQAALQILKLI